MDQYGNNVDGEIRVPIKDFHTQQAWRPLTKDDWIEKADARAPVPLDSRTEYAFAYADGSVNEEMVFARKGIALGELEHFRKQLKDYGIPEEYHPILMERTVETIASSWRVLSV